MRAENTWCTLGRSWRLRLLSGSDAGVLEAVLVFLKTRQTRGVDGQIEMMGSKETAAALLGKVDPSPFLQHFQTFSPRMYCSVVY